jgi:hypothetical protein
MEYSKSEWDLLLWPRSWHKRINTASLTLIPGIIWVGLFDVMLVTTNSILNDYIINSSSDAMPKTVFFFIVAIVIGFLDIFCFAWPIADLCRYIAKRSEKFIVPGFNIILMKSYAYSHLPFMPLLLLASPSMVNIEALSQNTSFFAQALMYALVILLYWQLGIMLRTISVKSKIKFSGKLIISLAIIAWSSLSAQALLFLINVAYKTFGLLFGT